MVSFHGNRKPKIYSKTLFQKVDGNTDWGEAMWSPGQQQSHLNLTFSLSTWQVDLSELQVSQRP